MSIMSQMLKLRDVNALNASYLKSLVKAQSSTWNEVELGHVMALGSPSLAFASGIIEQSARAAAHLLRKEGLSGLADEIQSLIFSGITQAMHAIDEQSWPVDVKDPLHGQLVQRLSAVAQHMPPAPSPPPPSNPNDLVDEAGRALINASRGGGTPSGSGV
jgi:hypothetical protein